MYFYLFATKIKLILTIIIGEFMSEAISASTLSLPLKELKNRLPIEVDGKENQIFVFRDWTFKEEEFIAKAKGKSSTMGRFISDVLSAMLVSIGDENFEAKTPGEKALFINRQPIGNVLYMYLYLRYDQLGSDLKLVFKCPFCSNEINDFVADIGDLDVDCRFGKFEEVVDYPLRKPITLEAGDQLVETLRLGISRWDVMEKANATDTNEAAMKKYSYRNSIVGAVGVPGYLNPDEVIQKLRKRDIESIGTIISQHNGGPSIQAEVVCKHCSNKFWRQIDWSYDYFFGNGSLPQT
jgi:hypothetical protein